MDRLDMTPEEIKQAFRDRYAEHLPIIGEYLFESHSELGEHFRLFFPDGTQIIAEDYGCGDSDNGLDLDDPDYEDFYGFYFAVKRIERQGTEWDFEVGEVVELTYHNFFTKFERYEGDEFPSKWEEEKKRHRNRVP